MNSKYDFTNLTESEHYLNLTNDNLNQNFQESYLPFKTEAYLSVR